MASRPTTFLFDLLIFSCRPAVTGRPDWSTIRPSSMVSTSSGNSHSLVGLMTNHSLCEKTRKGLVQIEVATLTQRTHVTSSECVAPFSTVLRSRPGDHVTNDNVLEFFEKRPLEPARRLNLEDTLPTANRKQRSCGNLIASTGSGGAGRAAWTTEPN